MIGAVALAVAATGVGYAAMSKNVTLSIDGKTEKIRTFDDNVGDERADVERERRGRIGKRMSFKGSAAVDGDHARC